MGLIDRQSRQFHGGMAVVFENRPAPIPFQKKLDNDRNYYNVLVKIDL